MASNPAANAPAGQQPTHVSEAAYEFLLDEILQWVESHSRQQAASSDREEEALLAAEMSAARLERMGYSVGYRLCERLVQHKPLSASENDNSPTQLEAVKFLCKEFWTEVFRKQIDKLQTNHRGVFVLKDMELRWLKRLPPDVEQARVSAIQLLAFPCGLIRGALANLGILAVVSCDFLADGKRMAACSFNIKIK